MTDIAINEALAYPGAYLNNDGTKDFESGMTLRDYFAGQTVIMLTNDYQTPPDQIARRAYKIADEMLKLRALLMGEKT